MGFLEAVPLQVNVNDFLRVMRSNMGFIAFTPTVEVSERISVPGGVHFSDLKLPLFQFDTIDGLSESDKDVIFSIVREAARESEIKNIVGDSKSVSLGHPFGSTFFTSINLSVEFPIQTKVTIDNFRAKIYNDIEKEFPRMNSSALSSWNPHVSIKYVETWSMDDYDEARTRLGSLEFDSIKVNLAGTIKHIKF